jgi:hypothetical protein
MDLNLDKVLHKFLHPRSTPPDFKFYPEGRPWPILYFEMLKEEPKTYFPALVNDLRRAVAESIKPQDRLNPWEAFNRSLSFDASEHYIWHRVIKHQKSRTPEEREADMRAMLGDLLDK